MSKFLGFLLGIAVALVGPAMFGVLAADGGIKLNAKEMALAYGIGALIFWAVLSYFSGAAALGAALTFGAMVYTVLWIPNRLTNFLNDVPGVTTGMIDGTKQYTLNGVVPILAVIALVFGIQSIVRTVQRRRRERAEAERLHREQEAAVQAQQMPEPVAAYPAGGGEYQPDNRFGGNFGNNNYDDLFDEESEPTPFAPRNQADEQTAQFDPGTVPMQYADERDVTHEARAEGVDETMLVPTDSDETALVPSGEKTVADGSDSDETVLVTPPQSDGRPEEALTQADAPEPYEGEATQPVPVPEPETPRHVAPRVAGQQATAAPEGEVTQAVPVAQPEVTRSAAPESGGAPSADAAPQAGGSVGAAGAPQAGGSVGAAAAPQDGRYAGSAAAPQDPGAASQVDDGGEATRAVPVTRPEVTKPAAPEGGVAPHATTVPQPGESASLVEDGGEATQAVPVTQSEVTEPAAPEGGVAPRATTVPQPGESASQVDDGGEATQAVPVARSEVTKPAAPESGGAPSPAAASQAGGNAGAAAAPRDSGAASQVDGGGDATQAVPVIRAEAPRVSTPHVGAEDVGEATQPVPVARPEVPRPAAPQAGLLRNEEVGQQYRERMDPPDVDDTGEFFVGAFENPPEHATQRMELPGQFRS